MDNASNWHDLAFDVYRLAWTELDSWKALRRDDLEYWIEELKEALLDLKQATIAEEPARALQHIDEITVLVAELRLRLGQS